MPLSCLQGKVSELAKPSFNYDRQPVMNASQADISLKDAELFFEATGLRLKSKAGIIERLKKRNMLKFITNQHLLVPTVAGLLLFGKDPESHLHQSKIKADAYQGIEPGNTIDQK